MDNATGSTAATRVADLDLTHIKKAIEDYRAHEHPAHEDFYCLNLVSWLGERAHLLVAEIERLQHELTAEIASTEREREDSRKDTGREISDRILDYRDALRHRGVTPRPSHIEDCARFAREIGGAQ